MTLVSAGRKQQRDTIRGKRPGRSATVDPGHDCPTPAKRHYATKLGALNTVRVDRLGTAGAPARAYKCPCGWWCLTSKRAHR